jgi:hypothetical protein
LTGNVREVALLPVSKILSIIGQTSKFKPDWKLEQFYRLKYFKYLHPDKSIILSEVPLDQYGL